MFGLPSFFIAFYVIQSSSGSDLSCFSPIYCYGELLHTVQTAKLFDDSKHFVDMMMNFDANIILENFKIFMNEKNNKPTSREVEKFVNQHFAKEDELEYWHAQDYSPEPPFLKKILNPSYKEFAKNLIPIWKFLGRKIKTNILNDKNISRFSIIPVPNAFIVPGGRFREFYYWDSYWIIVGLLHSGMRQTVKGMLDNFLWLVKTYGFIPNGGRIYYLNRSQPPMFLMMVEEYLKHSEEKEIEWLKKNILIMEMELNYWLKKKTVNFRIDNIEYTLARYIVNSSSPRPESYREDLQTCAIHITEELRNKCYRELKTGAESGWDFSSRWMTEKLELYDLKTSEIAPVDLNSFLVRSFRIMAQLFLKIERKERYNYWSKLFDKWSNTLHKLMYNEEDGIWYDFDLVKLKQNRQFFGSNLTPLWAQLYTTTKVVEKLGIRAVDYLLRNKIMNYNGGIPTSLYDSGEQWDLPNAWPNLQSIVILGLHRSGSEKAKEVAKLLADRWIGVNLESYKNTKRMYEKYNAETVGEAGNGGEYEVQSGFGWTNGVVLELIEEFFTAKQDLATLRSGCAKYTIEIIYFFFIILISRKIN